MKSKHDALVLVDIQYDFLPGGSLGVTGGDRILQPVQNLIDHFTKHKQIIIASRDWHPKQHCSFTANGGIWPEHCVQNTKGAEFSITLPADTLIISKASDETVDAYSAFKGTKLEEVLREKNIKRLFVVGLATDYCVLNTVLDARTHNFAVTLVTDAIAAVNVKEQDGEKAIQQMQLQGVETTTSHTIIN